MITLPPTKSTFALLLIVASAVASADPAYTFPIGKGGQNISPAFDVIEGDKFQVGANDVQVTRLAYEKETRPNQAAEGVGLFDAAGNLLTSATIGSTDTLTNGYYWQDITPYTLLAGQTYFVGGHHGTGAGHEYIWNTNLATMPSFLIDLNTWFKVSPTLSGGGAWQIGGGNIRHYVPNFEAHVVPEPASIAVVGFGLVGIAARRRMRRR